MNKSTNLWDRLLEVLEADNLDQAADILNINASTLRGRKARGSVPYDKIVPKLDSYQLAYVFKNEKLDKYPERSHLYPPVDKPETEMASDSDELNYDPTESTFENFLTGLMHRIEKAPFSKFAKLQIIDSVIRIAEKDFENIQEEKSHNPPDPKPEKES